MRYYRIQTDDGTSIVARSDEEAYDLTAVDGGPRSFQDLTKAARLQAESVDDIAAGIVERAPTLPLSTVLESAIRPVDPAEIWGAGVTYAISQEARQEAGDIADAYLNAYEAERPEVYFKSTQSRTVGPWESIGIRADSNWDVPEPELSVVLVDGEIVGYTIGNDVCSRVIERENLLYIPQSKIYKNSCSIGPCVATGESVPDPHSLDMSLTITRDGDLVYEGETSTSEMVRKCEELVSYMNRCNELPGLTVLLTGTSIIPPDDVTLEPEDHVSIAIENIGTLENSVERVSL